MSSETKFSEKFFFCFKTNQTHFDKCYY